jgi:hypothetical protein
MIFNLPSVLFAECFSTLGKAECPKKILDKECFTDKMFAKYFLLSLTLDKNPVYGSDILK